MKYGKTNWNEYYQLRSTNTKKTAGIILAITRFTRKCTEHLIFKMLKNNVQIENINRVIELGGGDSSFYLAFRNFLPQINFIAVDNSEVGVEVFNKKYSDKNTKAVLENAMDIKGKYEANLVFSAGLIEHFTAEETAKIVKAHFDLVSNSNEDGYVLITFPTPTLLYVVLRKIAELSGIWKFYDERPIKIKEALDECKKYGDVKSVKLNWIIGLTQYVLLVKKRKYL